MKNQLVKKISKMITKGETYWKWRFLPSPKKLGMSDSNSLASRAFSNQTGAPTWEDWDERVKKMHPIRYFLIEKGLPWVQRKWRPIKDFWYWLKCHFLKSHRYHLLDLRQPKEAKYDHKPYRYGWIDSDTQMLYAVFNILNNFVRMEMPNWNCPSEEEVEAEPHLMTQRHRWLETKAIHYWWNVERPRQIELHAKMLDEWSEAREQNTMTAQQLWDKMHKLEKSQDDQEDEMLCRLLKIRHSLWI